MKFGKRVVLGISGGIDSSSSAYFLKQKGYEVIGVYLDLWRGFTEKEDHADSLFKTKEILKNLENKIGIKTHIIDKKEEFKQIVVDYFLKSLSAGRTPNPCVVCNKNIKFKTLLQFLNEFDADYIATGHYARKYKNRDGTYSILKGLDASKDQSYYLCKLNQDVLSRTIFPLGEEKKEEIKPIFREIIDPECEITESQDLCFLSNHDYREFLNMYAPQSLEPGKIVSKNGKILGEHKGLALYTIGQRKGLGVSSSEPLFVVKKDIGSNTLIIGKQDELIFSTFTVNHMNWINDKKIVKEKTYSVKIRYRAKPVLANIKYQNGNSYKIKVHKPLRDITPGQFACFYHKEIMLGGGEISL